MSIASTGAGTARGGPAATAVGHVVVPPRDPRPARLVDAQAAA